MYFLFYYLQFLPRQSEQYQSCHKETSPSIPVVHPRKEDVSGSTDVKTYEPRKREYTFYVFAYIHLTPSDLQTEC